MPLNAWTGPLGAVLAPVGFVLLWSTGFVVARSAAPHADLSFFLAARFGLAALLLGGFALTMRAGWPAASRSALHIGIGGLMHGVYLVTGYAAIKAGLAVGVMALIGGLQPIIAAGIATALGARATRWLWIGLVLGFIGLALTIAPGLGDKGGSLSLGSLGLAFAGVLALSVAAVLQERIGRSDDLVCVSALQHAGGAILAIVAALLWGDLHWDGAGELWFAFAWATLGISLGAVGLLITLIRRDGAAKASALLLLVPPFAALQGWILFGERLNLIQIMGFLIALLGVWLARRKETP